ncbi:auxin efflux carrier component 6 [Pyrus ussuriensis x Pyrus communis]|uniref:Auxin efflux carrier component n=1 Tax=Pyrus ussuriensis x Pyrus communis TaxID=2448454 RepID=A0A5N5FKZ8_9ROSA|nr:auxin efflux carrier component 6 isoform X2 [Pyrus x bretschneideri]KAB2603623.1 auxin efflux carrier component 6 [Pyrus ussuriensis x Pyrus communis]
MITAQDFYKVSCAIVPLYFAMLVAYASVKWCKIFSPEQCSGINRFVAVFAVPVLSFHFISQNNPYQMDTKFILADTFSKLLVLALLSLWSILFKAAGGLDWLITIFSVATLPNTLVMGIPLLKAMYGDFTQSLMVQVVVLQCIVWYTLLLFLFEYRAATLLIQTQFPGPTAAAITKFEIDDDIISLDGRNPLCTESETDQNGRIRVRIRRSTSSVPGSSALSSSMGLTPRPSNLSNAEIFSINTPHHHANLEFTLGSGDVAFGYRSTSPQLSAGYASSDAYSLQPTPRASTFNEIDTTTFSTTANTPVWARSPATGRFSQQPSPTFNGVKMVWESPAKCQGGGGDQRQGYFKELGDKEISFRDCTKIPMPEVTDTKVEAAANQEMPSAPVMLRLILIMVGRKLSRNPNTYSSVLGLVWSLISFKWDVGMPSLVKYSIKLISDAGLGMAMFSLGLFMALQPRILACGTKRATMGMVVRFICGPLLMAAASAATGLRGVKLHAAIVQAALPQGIVPFVFAREYGLHPDILSTGVIFGMLVSLPVTLLYYILLGLY